MNPLTSRWVPQLPTHHENHHRGHPHPSRMTPMTLTHGRDFTVASGEAGALPGTSPSSPALPDTRSGSGRVPGRPGGGALAR